jgi:hypothetical protein
VPGRIHGGDLPGKLSKEKAKEILQDIYKVDSSSQLTVQQADEFIKYLKS